MSPLVRFLIRFARPARDVRREREVLLDADGAARSATLYLPDGASGSRPAWVLLQGLTVPGRHHEGVRRMARALAAAGHLVVVPEVPSWTQLRVDPREIDPAVRSALGLLRRSGDADMRRVGLMGFSVAGIVGARRRFRRARQQPQSDRQSRRLWRLPADGAGDGRRRARVGGATLPVQT